MESVMMIFFIILLLFFTYGYSSYYFYKHKTDPKTIFIPRSENKKNFVVSGQTDGQSDGQTDGQSDGQSDSQTDGQTDGQSASSTCDPKATYKEDGDNSMFCLNGGKCLESSSGTSIYNCSCVEPYIGDNCWSKGTENTGIRVDIMDNFTSPTEIKRVAMFNKSGKNSFIQYNDYL